MTAMPGPMARQLCRVVSLFILATGVLCDAVAQTPPAPVVTLASGVKRIEFSWPVVPGASYYVVKESATTGAPFVAISPRIPQGRGGEVLEYTRAISVHRQDWLPANAGAVFLFQRSVDNRWLQSRYIKAPNPDADDHFGGAFLRGALVLSGDATTLVAPAADEDGPNDATPGSGAVYLY